MARNGPRPSSLSRIGPAAARVLRAVSTRRGRLSALALTRAHRYGLAQSAVRRLVDAAPSDAMRLQWLARLATLRGDRATAASAWTRLREVSQDYMADEYDARIGLLTSPKVGTPRIVIIGNCQAYPLAKFLRQTTGARVVAVTPRDFVDPVLADLVVEEIRGFDHIVSQPVARGWGALATPRLKAVRGDLVEIPSLVFSGFQPDLLPIAVELWPGPPTTFKEFHSLLGMAAFLRGFSPARAAELFNSYVFAKLGYFDEYQASRRYLLEEGARSGFDLSGDLAAWERYGVFFHTHNHPAVPVLWGMARRLADRLGLDVDDGVAPPPLYFRENVWPLYPDLARPLGLVGSFAFRPPNQPGLDLDELLARDFEAYARTDFTKLESRRVREIGAALDAMGARP